MRFLTILVTLCALIIGGAAGAVYLGLVPGIGPTASSDQPDVTAAVVSPVEEGATVASATAPGPQTAQTALPPTPGVQSVPQRQVVDRQSFGDWTYLCTADAAGGDRSCALLQELSQTGTNTKVLSWRITVGASGNLLSSWEVPTGLKLRAGFQLDYGGEKPIVVPYDTCSPNSCVAVAEFGDEFQQRLVAAPKVTGAILNTANKGLAFTLSANGLDDAVAALRASATAVQPVVAP